MTDQGGYDVDEEDSVDSDPTAWDLESAPHVGSGSFRPTAEGPAEGVVYAELPLRAVAFLVDVLLVGLIGTLVSAVAYAFASAAIFNTSQVAQTVSSVLLLNGLMPSLAGLVFGGVAYVYFMRVFRASPGQSFLGLFTLTEDGLTLSTGAAVGRWALRLLPITGAGSLISLIFAITRDGGASSFGLEIGLWTGLLYLVPIVWPLLLAWSIARDRERGRGWHDRLAGSVVVRREGPPS